MINYSIVRNIIHTSFRTNNIHYLYKEDFIVDSEIGKYKAIAKNSKGNIMLLTCLFTDIAVGKNLLSMTSQSTLALDDVFNINYFDDYIAANTRYSNEDVADIDTLISTLQSKIRTMFEQAIIPNEHFTFLTAQVKFSPLPMCFVFIGNPYLEYIGTIMLISGVFSVVDGSSEVLQTICNSLTPQITFIERMEA